MRQPTTARPGCEPANQTARVTRAGQASPNSGHAYRLRRFPNGYWRICWTQGRVTHSRSTRCRDEAGAKLELQRWLEARRPKPRSYSVTMALADYLDDRRGEVAAHARLQHAAKPVRRLLGRLKVAELTPAVARRYARARRAEGIGDGTIGRELAALRAALRLAKGEGRIRDVPMLPLPERPPPRDRWLQRADAERLLAAAALAHIRLFILLALHTAARCGAILGLRWRQVDLDALLIDFRAPGRKATAKGRAVVPINGTLRTALLTARETILALCLTKGRSANINDAPVIAWRGRPLRCVARGVAAACRRAAIEGVTPHIFRHTAATWMAQAGVPIERIAQYLGHTNPAITAKVYAKHRPDWLRDAAAALDGRAAA